MRNILLCLAALAMSCSTPNDEVESGDNPNGDSLKEQLSQIEIAPRETRLNEYGFDSAAMDYVESVEYFADIEAYSCWNETLEALTYERALPNSAQIIRSADQLLNMQSGKVYYVKGDIVIPTTSVTLADGKIESKGIDVPDNVTLYVEGSIYKEGLFMGDLDPNDGIEEENKWDFIFDLEDSKCVNIYGMGRAKISSAGRSVAFYMGADASDVYIEGFYVTNVWEAFSSQYGAKRIVIQRNSIERTGKRAIWMLGTEDSNFSYNFIYLAGWDGFDFDAHNKRGVCYGNIIIGAGRWAGFVEEAAQYNYIVRSLSVMEATHSQKRWQMGFADNGTSRTIISKSGKLTENNYFIENMTVQPSIYSQQSNNRGGGNFFAYKNVDKGMTYFWGNIELGCEHNEDGSKWYKAIWLDHTPTNAQTKIKQLQETAHSYME